MASQWPPALGTMPFHTSIFKFFYVCVRTCLPFTAGVGATAQAADFPDAALYCQGSCTEWIIFLDFEFNCQNAIIYYLFFFKIAISKWFELGSFSLIWRLAPNRGRLSIRQLVFRPNSHQCSAGYVDIGLIPEGARDIRIEEVAEAGNFLALRSDNPNKYFLNGGWTIQWNGEYKAAGTVFTYERTGHLENLTSPGPTMEPLWIQVKIKQAFPLTLFIRFSLMQECVKVWSAVSAFTHAARMRRVWWGASTVDMGAVVPTLFHLVPFVLFFYSISFVILSCAERTAMVQGWTTHAGILVCF